MLYAIWPWENMQRFPQPLGSDCHCGSPPWRELFVLSSPKQRNSLEILTLWRCGLFSCGGGTGRRSFLSFIWKQGAVKLDGPLTWCVFTADITQGLSAMCFPHSLPMLGFTAPSSQPDKCFEALVEVQHTLADEFCCFSPSVMVPGRLQPTQHLPALTFWAGTARTGCSLHLCSWSTKTWFVAPGPLLVWQLGKYYIWL